MEQELNYGIMPGETWQHYKGGNYKIITLANHTETKEPLVIYQSISFGSTYARPLSIWCEAVENRRGGLEPRFVKVEDVKRVIPNVISDYLVKLNEGLD